MTYALAEPLQRALYDTLTSDPALGALIGSAIYDAPLPLDGANAPSEYVTIGVERVDDYGSQSCPGAIHDFSVVVHSDAEGFIKSKTVAAAICDVLLDAQLPLTRGALIYLRFLKARADVGKPPERRTISLRFRAFIEDTLS